MKISRNLIGIRTLKKLRYDTNKDLAYNERLLKKLSFSKKKIISKLNKSSYDYYNYNLSWHYHIFSGLEIRKPNILEIGTFVGNFTNYLSKIFPEGKIYTVDLEENHKNFVFTYNKNLIKNRNHFNRLRKKNLSKKNIKVIKENSFNLPSIFKQNYFDLIWIDGDHLDPQVSLDVFTSYHLLKKRGIFCCDDVNLNINDPVRHRTDVDKILKYLEKNKLVKTYYFIKRINKNNSFTKKYCSISYKI